MNLDNIRVEIRPRSAFEAIDLGFAMARHWFVPLWLIYIVVVLPPALMAILFSDTHLYIFFIVIWWLKPVYERPLVFWLGRAFFDEKISLKEIFKQYFKIIQPRLIPDLTYLRFSPNRSFFMPVAILENLKGKAYSNRGKVLGYNQSEGIGLTFICVVFTMILFFSIMLTIFFVLPEELRWTNLYDFIFGTGTFEAALGHLISIAAMSIIAPFYVAAGFCLYINRRTELEAWDIEINFKRLVAGRVKAQNARKTASSVTGLILLLTAIFLFSNPMYTNAHENIEKQETAKIVKKILEHDDFGKKKTTTAWKLKEFDKVDFDLPQWLKDFFILLGEKLKWMRNIPKFSSVVFETIAWGLCSLLIIFIAYKIGQNRQWFQYFKKAPQRRIKAPLKLFGLDLSEKSLPDDIIRKVKYLLKNNEIRKALSLLYRGALVRLINDFNLQISVSATENECIRLVKLQREKKEATFFKTLTQIWLAMAYGHITPDKKLLEEVCQNWQIIYGK